MNDADKLYSGLDLLDKVLEFIAMTPNPHEWNLVSLKSNPPRHIRLQQITSLFYAFNFTRKIDGQFAVDKAADIENFLNGSLLKTDADYSKVFAFMDSFVKSNGFNNESKFHTADLPYIFQQLVKYKRQFRALLEFNSGVIEASSKRFLFPIFLTDSISKKISGESADLDYVLELLINPQGLQFIQKELIENYNFPDDDLFEIDMDFM